MDSELFSLSINAPGSEPLYKYGHKYVALRSGTTYSINVKNLHDTRSDIEVYIDGIHVGSWMMPAHSSLTLERPAHINKKFTFFEETSRVAQSTGTEIGAEDNGLINVIFKPEKQKSIYRTMNLRAASSLETASAASSRSSASPKFSNSIQAKSYKAGVTVLGDQSKQRFGTTSSLRDDEIDWNLSTELSIRLVVKKDTKYISLVPRITYPPRLDNYDDSDEYSYD